jgi:hypothetical protein
MTTIILIALASICNAAMDVCAHKFWHSRFHIVFNQRWNSFFNTSESWKNKYVNKNTALGRRKINLLGILVNYPVQLTDSFHLFKSTMIVCWAFAAVCYVPIVQTANPTINMLTDVFILGTTWNITFSLFYKKVFLR